MSHTVRKSLSIGDWKHEGDKGHGMVHLIQQRGSHWSVHGHMHKGSMVLLPEEALFLMECNALQVLCEEKPLSIQEAYHTFLSDSCLAVYQVYASLKRIGFIVRRTRLLVSQQATESRLVTLSTVTVCPLCTVPPTDHDSATEMERGGEELLEVYKPRGSKKGTSFCKSDPGPPDFRILIARPCDEFPSAERIRQLYSIQPPSSLRVCLTEGANLTYYTLSPLNN